MVARQAVDLPLVQITLSRERASPRARWSTVIVSVTASRDVVPVDLAVIAGGGLREGWHR